VDYSIIIPVFNKAGLTRNCLETLRPTLEGAGEGEVIVVDNASSDETPEMLREFPWLRVMTNERNLGFAAANNQAAREARGKFLVLLNNDTQGLPGWLAMMMRAMAEPGVGAVGARLLYANNTIQHAGVVVSAVLFGRSGIAPYHFQWKTPANDPDVLVPRDYQVVTGACLVTPRELYTELGGLDEIYWNGYEDVDYCFKVRARGLRVVYEPRAALYHFESQSGVQRFRKTLWNVRTLADRWTGKVELDSLQCSVGIGRFPVLLRDNNAAISTLNIVTPPTTAIVHGSLAGLDRVAMEASVRANQSPVAAVQFCDDAVALEAARAAMLVRGEKFLAFVAAGASLQPGWLDELIAQIAAPPNVAVSTFAPELPIGQNVASLGADARCTLLSLRQIPQHLGLGDFDSLDGAVADLTLRLIEFERGTRGVARALGTLPAVKEDASFERARTTPISAIFDTSAAAAERILRARPVRERGLVSIVTLSWNAPVFTQKALESIRAHTSEPYEVIVVDNGSGPETHEMLAKIDDPHVRIIYNATNRGFGGGNNDGMAAARGDYVVILNNDVLVTDGWLDGLLEPFKHLPGLGVTAPRSNLVVGHQQLICAYESEVDLAGFAAQRAEKFAGQGYFADRAIGLCLCVDRTLLEQIGGFDERFELGNFEDDDLCIRVRAAGYTIFICNDVFIHHFGSQSFAANKVDYTKTMTSNWTKFAEKWGYPPEYPTNGYVPRVAFARGFDRRIHFAPLVAARVAPAARRDARLTFHAAVGNEAEWAPVAEFVKRFARAFTAADGALFTIGVFGDLTAETLGARAEKIFRRAGIDPAGSADVEISDEDDVAVWETHVKAGRAIDIATIADRSPSGLRRLAEDWKG
jgi:GT2 family glycosyltransferase